MTRISRRNFLQSATALTCAATVLRGTRLMASPLGLPLGLQLYSVREMLPKDFAGTLKHISSLGYREVESAGYYKHSVAEVKQALADAGLAMPSAHYSHDALAPDLDQILAFNKEIGVQTIVCSYPGHKTPVAAKDARNFSLEDWRWNAEEFNKFGAKAKAAGLAFGYHNHTIEFRAQGGVVPYDELMKLTDPSLVTFEMDCGWVTVGGGDPVALLKKYPTRITMLHVKDFKKATAPVTPEHPPEAAVLGTGTADYHAIFAAAKSGNIKHYFVEQESFDGDPWQELKADADYVLNLKA